MITQDDAREIQIINLCSLIKSDVRDGIDAFDESGNLFEIKSTTKKSKSISTARDVHLHTVERWRKQHWIMAWGSKTEKGMDIKELYVAHPDDLEPFFQKVESKIRKKYEVAAKFIMANTSEPEEDRVEALKVVKRGSSLNDPTISWKLIRERCTPLDASNPTEASRAVRHFISAKPVKSKSTFADKVNEAANAANKEKTK